MATKKKTAAKVKSPAPINKAAATTSGQPQVQEMVSGTPGGSFDNVARYSDAGAMVTQTNSTAQPDLGYDDTPLSGADGQDTTYTYVSTAPLYAVQSAKQS